MALGGILLVEALFYDFLMAPGQAGSGYQQHGVSGFASNLGGSFSGAIASSSTAPSSSSGGGGSGW